MTVKQSVFIVAIVHQGCTEGNSRRLQPQVRPGFARGRRAGGAGCPLPVPVAVEENTHRVGVRGHADRMPSSDADDDAFDALRLHQRDHLVDALVRGRAGPIVLHVSGREVGRPVRIRVVRGVAEPQPRGSATGYMRGGVPGRPPPDGPAVRIWGTGHIG